MSKLFIALILIFSAFPALVFAQETVTPQQELDPNLTPVENFIHARVVEILVDEQRNIAGSLVPYQQIIVELLDGDEQGKHLTIEHLGSVVGESQKYKQGERVLVTSIEYFGEIEYHIVDSYRVPSLIWIGAIFVGIVFLFARFKGITALLGLTAGIIILALYVVPKILEGGNPIFTSLVGAVIIAVLSLYLAHGISRQTTIALAGTLITLFLAVGFSWVFIKIANLNGLGSEEAFFLQLDPRLALNLKGLLLGGILIGALGVLDDVTTAQAAVVHELKKANASFNFGQLYTRGLTVGREHIVSLVNTLALAYIGASFPLFLYFALDNPQPLWVTFNSEFIAEEIIRTLVGSTALVLAVPITTALAAWHFGKQSSSAELKGSTSGIL